MTRFSVALGFYPFGEHYGDRYGRAGDDVFSCVSVSSQFPLFTTKEHSVVCVSFIFLRLDLLQIYNVQTTFKRRYVFTGYHLFTRWHT